MTLAACPKPFNFTTACAAAPRSAMGPIRTRYRREDPAPLGDTKAATPCALNWRCSLSALSWLAKLPSCTVQPRPAVADFPADRLDVGGAGGVSSDVDAAALPETALGGSSFRACGCALDAAGTADAVGTAVAAAVSAAG